MRYYHQRNVIQLMLPKNVPSEIPYQLIALYIIVTINANRHQEKQKYPHWISPPPWHSHHVQKFSNEYRKIESESKVIATASYNKGNITRSR